MGRFFYRIAFHTKTHSMNQSHIFFLNRLINFRGKRQNDKVR